MATLTKLNYIIYILILVYMDLNRINYDLFLTNTIKYPVDTTI